MNSSLPSPPMPLSLPAPPQTAALCPRCNSPCPFCSPSRKSQPSLERQKSMISGGGILDAGPAWTLLREQLNDTYFRDADDELDPEEEKSEAMMAEAVLAYDAMSVEERSGESGRSIIRNVSPALELDDVAEEWDRLRYHKKEILDAIYELFRRPMFGESQRNQKMGYSAVKMRGRSDLKEICFVPEGMKVSPSTISTDVLGKKAWRLNKPNMLIKIDFGARHPAALSTPALVNLAAFKHLKKSAALAVSRTTTGDISEQQKDSLIQKSIDEYLQMSLGKELMTAIIDAAIKTNNWIVIDRSNSAASSPTAELLLETSLGVSGKKPTVLAFDSVSRYKNFKPSRGVNRQLLIIGDILCNSVGLDDARDAEEISPLYEPSMFEHWEPYHLHDPLLLGEPGVDEKLVLEGDRRLPRKPEAAMVMVDDTGRQRSTCDGRPLITPELKWLYHYRQYLFNGGSHYVIFEDAITSEFSMSSNGVPWPEGSIFAHGGNLAFDRIQQSLFTGTPTVMLYNSGGVAQTFASLHNWCVSRNVAIRDECLRTGKDATEVILARTDVVSSEPWTKRFGLPCVAQFQRLEKRAPEVMRRSVAVVDLLQDTPEQVVEKVTGCFASGGKGLPELGLGTAEEDIMLSAWQAHMTFTSNSHRFRCWGDFFYYLSLVLIMISALFAVLVTKEDYTTGMTSEVNFDVGKFCKRTLLIVPVASSILASIMSKKRFIQKWAALKTASAQIVTEIYKFRTDVQEYDPRWQSEIQAENDNDFQDEDGGPADNRIFNPREIFVKRFQEINKFALDRVGEDSLTLPPTSKLDLKDNAQKEIFKQQLRGYVPMEVLGQDSQIPRYFCCRPRKSMQVHPQKQWNRSATSPDLQNENSGVGKLDENKQDDPEEGRVAVAANYDAHDAHVSQVEPDDFVSPMTIETYIEYRSKGLLRLCERTSPPLAKRLANLETMVIVTGALGTLLAALEQPRWVAVTVAAVTSMMNITEHEMLQQRLSSTNNAMRELTDNKIVMESLSIVAKRTQEMKTLCVGTVETAMLETTTSWTGMSARPSIQVNEGENDKHS
eukprot:gnl/MRDRNA2_/MRDRNA2_75748_c0_seq1.p1 gnl/MRDRNA2_/MRDRNA2_75748_c0~~gnl/MRDRNA2_/MRDRNA2_75748_c0_seq1.p1  ORF type:complete len:1059 (+),score=185.89 gnl/MRDRNA2_/MRDRNA2_75748_c0_seq1:157-3333(+)